MSTRKVKNTRRTRRAAAFVALGCVGAASALGLASCSLGLDEGLIGKVAPEAAAADVVVADTSVAEGGDGALPPLSPEAGICATDQDCKGATGCLTAKCDVPRKACVFQVCRQPACNSAACDLPTSKCSTPKAYKYRAAQFPVGAPIGCGGVANIARCFAAVYPFVFVGTANGVVAFAANDPQNATPASVPITGLGFLPSQIIASGSRVYFLGTAVATGATSRVPLAWADVPPDPFAAKITATTILAFYNRPAGDPLTLFPRGNDTALLVDFNPAAPSLYATAPLEPPLIEPVTLNSSSTAFTAGAVPVGVSGSRLIMEVPVTAAGVLSFGFVNAAGSATPQTLPDVAIATATPAYPPQSFAPSADGAFFWAHSSLTVPPSGPAPVLVRAAKGYFLVADGAANFDPAAGIDLDVYPPALPSPPAIGAGTPVVGPVAMLDAKTAMVTTAFPANPGAVTNVQFVDRQPLAIRKNDDLTPRKFQITQPITQLAAAGSNGLGYVLAYDAAPALPPASTLSVYVFDPGCAP
jgi:hypothetical protein